MKKLVLATLIASSLSPFAFADDRKPVDQKVLSLVESHSKIEDFRVYISKRVKIQRKSSQTTQAQVNAGVSLESTKKIQDEKLGHRTRGKIISKAYNNAFEADLLYVSFDKSCVEKSCSYVFSRLDGTYKLLAVPNYGMDQLIVKSKKAVLYTTWQLRDGNLYGLGTHHTLYGGNNSYKHRPILEYKLSESDSTIRDEVRNRGW